MFGDLYLEKQFVLKDKVRHQLINLYDQPENVK